MNTSYIDIEGKRVRSFEELKLLFDSPEAKIPGSSLYLRLIDLAIDSALADYLQNIGKAEMAEMIRALDFQQSDLQIMNELQRIITGSTVDIDFNPLSFIQVLNTSISKGEHAVQTCFEIQILKAVKENMLFSVVCGTERSEKQLNLEGCRNGEIVSVSQELPKSAGEVLFLINEKEVSRVCFQYDVVFQCNIPDANLFVDGKQIASSFPITQELPYGSHTIRVLCAGYRTFEEEIMVKEECDCQIRMQQLSISEAEQLFKEGNEFYSRALEKTQFTHIHSCDIGEFVFKNYFHPAAKAGSPSAIIEMVHYYKLKGDKLKQILWVKEYQKQTNCSMTDIILKFGTSLML